MKYFLLVVTLMMAITCAMAQQDPLYSQYFNNPMLINPAFAGSNERLYSGLAYRAQWAGIEGGPATFNFNSHISLFDNRVGAGIIVVQDKIGDIKNTQYGTSYSYRIKLSKSTFSFGMQAGFVQYATDRNGVNPLDPTDPRLLLSQKQNSIQVQVYYYKVNAIPLESLSLNFLQAAAQQVRAGNRPKCRYTIKIFICMVAT